MGGVGLTVFHVKQHGLARSLLVVLAPRCGKPTLWCGTNVAPLPRSVEPTLSSRNTEGGYGGGGTKGLRESDPGYWNSFVLHRKNSKVHETRPMAHPISRSRLNPYSPDTKNIRKFMKHR